MMKLHTLTAAAVLSIAAMATPAQASILSSMLSYDGTPDMINDNSVSQIYAHDGNTNRALEVGDQVVGLLNFEDINGTDLGGGTYIISIFAFEIVAFNPGFDGVSGTIDDFIELGAIPSGDATSIQSLLDDALEPVLGVGDWDDAVGAVLSTTTAPDPFLNSTDDPLTIISSMTAAAGWDLELIDGIVDGDDFLHARVNAAALLPGFLGGMDANNDGTLTIDEIKADNSGQTLLTDRAALTVQAHNMGSGIIFLPLPLTQMDGSAGFGDIVIQPDGSVQTSTSGTPNWDLVNDTNFLINAVPEPGSMTLMAMGLAGLGGFSLRRRRKDEEQEA